MGWRDELVWYDKTLKKAAFRDATFYIEGSEAGVGRRNAIHQYPFRETPYVEDLGSDATEFTIYGYVIQTPANDFNYLAEKDKLVNALRKKGSGVLVHPFYGRLTVCLQGKARIEESSISNGGIARFTMTFVETGVNKFPEHTLDPVTTIAQQKQSALVIAEADFSDKYEYSSDSNSTIVEASSSLGSVINSLLINVRNPTSIIDVKAAIANANAYVNNINDYISTATNYITFVTRLLDDPLRTLGLTAPYNIGNSLVQAYSSLVYFGDAISNISLSRYLNNLEPVTIRSNATAKRALNQTAIKNLVKIKGVLNATTIASITEYDSYERAKGVTRTVVDAFDIFLDNLGDTSVASDFEDYGVHYSVDDLYAAMLAIKSNFVESMKLVGADLAPTEIYEIPPNGEPSIVLVYNKYKDLAREDELLLHNVDVISNPGFLPGGKELRVLAV